MEIFAEESFLQAKDRRLPFCERRTTSVYRRSMKSCTISTKTRITRPCRRRLSSQISFSPALKAISSAAGTYTPNHFFEWLEKHKANDLNVTIRSASIDGRLIDRTVASKELQPGDRAFSIPLDLVVTLDRVFNDETLAELLTTNKLSELACLTLYMMYEKKNGRKSFWYSFIKELDRLRAIGQQGTSSPVLWPPAEAERLLEGSPVLQELHERIQGIENEYIECDTVWYLAGSLFNAYPYDIPTECFSRDTFRQAFAAIQATVVHLQNVPLSQRFALVPLGPPLVTYSPTSKVNKPNGDVFGMDDSQALLKLSQDGQNVELVVDRAYKEGEPIIAWCGPQPNRRLLINYGIVDENNPFDYLQVTASILKTDPLYQRKRTLLLENGFAAQKQVFRLQRFSSFPLGLLTFMRVAMVHSEGLLAQKSIMDPNVPEPLLDNVIYSHLVHYFEKKLKGYRSTIQEDMNVKNDPEASAREKVAATLLCIEKQILHQSIEALLKLAGVQNSTDLPAVSSEAPVELN